MAVGMGANGLQNPKVGQMPSAESLRRGQVRIAPKAIFVRPTHTDGS